MSDRRYPIEEVARHGDEIYDREIRPQVDGKDEYDGKVVAIDVDTGFYSLADDDFTAVDAVFEKHPAAEIWLVRIGKHAMTRIGYWKKAQRKAYSHEHKKKVVIERIKHFEERITKGREYLATGKHANWHGFRPLFAAKTKQGTELPPHKDWVKNVFLIRYERALSRAHRILARLE